MTEYTNDYGPYTSGTITFTTCETKKDVIDRIIKKSSRIRFTVSDVDSVMEALKSFPDIPIDIHYDNLLNTYNIEVYLNGKTV